MDGEEAAEYVSSDPNIGVEEAEFHVGFSKADDRANFSSSIRGTSARALRHTEINVDQIHVYYEENNEYENMEVEDFEGDGEIVNVTGDMTIGLLKLNSKQQSNLPTDSLQRWNNDKQHRRTVVG